MTAKRIVGLAEEAITRAIIGAFFEVYNTLGYGFLESVYVEALARELRRLGHHVEREVMVRIWYKGEVIARQRVDMIIDGSVIVEIKAGLALHSTAPRQLYNYLRATDKEVGLLLHFGPKANYFREYCPNSRKDGQSVVSGSVREIRSLLNSNPTVPSRPVDDDVRQPVINVTS